MREKESFIIRLLRFFGLIETVEVSKKDMCESAKSICSHECDSCAWRE